jgi:hypothetical protein
MNEKAPPVMMNWSSASGHFACRIEAPLDPRDGDIMRIHVGCALSFDFPKRSYVAAASIFKVVAFGPAVACLNVRR